jgi:hypothetical protein
MLYIFDYILFYINQVKQSEDTVEKKIQKKLQRKIKYSTQGVCNPIVWNGMNSYR